MTSANTAPRRRKRVRLIERRKVVGLSQEDLAGRINVARSTVGRWEAGDHPPQPFLRPPLARALNVTLEELEFLLVIGDPPATSGATTHGPSDAAATVGGFAGPEGDTVDRREFMALAGTTFAGVVLTPTTVLQDLSLVLVDPGQVAEPGADLTVATLEQSVARMKRAYQACLYDDVAAELPDVITRLGAGEGFVVGDERLRTNALMAQAKHVAASVLLKLDGDAMAAVAANQSLEAAQRSEDPLTIGASARTVTHTLMASGQNAAAHQFAADRAARLAADFDGLTPDAISIYGSLLLRGAIAAAQDEAADQARTMLDEAEDAALRIEHAANHQWTAFCLDNVLAHRMAVEISLGNAGTAVENLRKIKLDNLGIAERKATVCIDAARAFTQWGKYDKAVNALHAAEEISTQELQVRPVTRDLVRQIRTGADPSVRSSLNNLVARVGIAA